MLLFHSLYEYTYKTSGLMKALKVQRFDRSILKFTLELFAKLWLEEGLVRFGTFLVFGDLA